MNYLFILAACFKKDVQILKCTAIIRDDSIIPQRDLGDYKFQILTSLFKYVAHSIA